MIRSFFLVIALTVASLYSRAQQSCPVIPLPSQSTPVKAVFPLSDQTPLSFSEPSLLASANMLQQQLLQYAGIRLAISDKSPGSGILLKRVKGDNPAAYTLQMTGTQVTVSASGDEGIFYGLMSLMQLVRTAKPKQAAAQVPCWNITDQPLFGWRGFMLDESRQFFGKAVVKKILDEMAFYKLNRFHWHLTDQPGWRIEIKQYPRLTLVGGIGVHGNPDEPAQYYRQDEIKEIVAYAKERHITVTPEIDMPGHATAANKAYPQFSGGGSAKYPDFTFNPGKEETYQYLTNILKEVNVLFPSQMIHIGGDEVSFGSESWKTDAAVQQLMQSKGLKSLLEVEHYFIKRMADTLLKLNSKVLGWDEVTAAQLPAKATIVFWWRHDKAAELKNALDKGYNVVLCPRLPYYFDFVQDSSNIVGRRWKGEFNQLQRVYDFSLATLPVSVSGKASQVEGIQANLWTETVRTAERAYYMTFPRLLALAEAAWTAPEKRDFPQFEQRLKKHLPLLKEQGIYYMESPEKTPEPIR